MPIAICRVLHFRVGIVLFAFGLLLNLSARGAVTFTVSPGGVSNLYAGTLRLQITGLTNGETVSVEKYLDANTNRIIDSPDWLVQSFSLTDGQAAIIAGVTNFNIPGDTTPTNGSITANVSFPDGGFAQQIAGSYIFRLSSPSGRFVPITNFFTVTNLAYGQSFTGTVRSSGSNVPYAPVLLFTPPTGNGGMNPVAGTVANNLGTYTVRAPAGTYLVWAIRSNYVANLSTAPVLTLGAGATVTTNLTISPATRTISGRLVDAANNALGIPGISLFFQSTSNLVASGSSDANGNFTIALTSSQWKFGGDSSPLDLHGYLSLQSEPWFDTTTGSVSGVTIALPKGTALIYGSLKDDQNRPLVNIRLTGQQDDGSGPYRGDATTDTNGNYVMAVTSGNWSVDVSSDSGGTAGYIFPSASTNVADGTAVPLNFIGVLATNQISGFVHDTSNNPITNVGVNASAVINGVSYNQYAQSDGNGNYSFKVANGLWNVGLNCGGGSDSLNQLGYLCVNNQMVGITNNNGIANFIATLATAHISGYVLDSSSNPVVNVDVYARDPSGTYFNVNGSTDNTGYYTLNVANGTWNVGVSCYGGNNGLSQLGYLCVNEQPVAVTNATVVANFTALAAPYQITGYVRDTGNNPITNVNVNANATINGIGYNVSGLTDANGSYTLQVANGNWNVNVSCNGGLGNDLTSQGYLCVNGQSVLISNTNGTANFSVLTTAYQITGYVRDTGGHPITNVNVTANATINGTMYNIGGLTDANGFYSLNIASGDWNVNVNCNGGPGKDLASQGYLCVNGQSITISNTNGVANFTALSAPYQITGYVRDIGGRPITNININASATINGTMYFVGAATDTNGFFVVDVSSGNWSVNVDCNALSTLGYLCANNQSVNVSTNSGVANFIVTTAPYQIAGYVSDLGGKPITNVSIYGNANINGTNYNANGTTDAGGHYVVYVVNGAWNIGVACSGFNGLNQAGYLCVNSKTVNVSNNNAVVNFTAAPATFHITGTVRDLSNRPVTNVNVYANSGPYTANSTTDNNGFYSLSVASGSWDVNVDCNGLSAQGYACASDQITNILNADAVVNFTVQSSLINFRPTLASPGWAGPGQFQFTFNTVNGLIYTIEYGSDPTSWSSWFSFGGTGGPITITDPSATPAIRFYRVKVSP
jgi:hypothetical protein